MSDPLLPGDPDIPLVLRRSSRAKRISLRISQLDGRVTLTLPKRVPETEALAFARQKESWIRKHLSARAADVPVGVGAQLPIGGVMHQVLHGSGRQVEFAKAQVFVPGNTERAGKRLAGHLKAIARARLAEASDHYAARLGMPYAAITLRDTRSRWGSCTSEGRLMYSWRLILAPPEVLDYVAAHEVAHLQEMNHGPAFYALQSQLWPAWREHRQELREHGHRYTQE